MSWWNGMEWLDSNMGKLIDTAFVRVVCMYVCMYVRVTNDPPSLSISHSGNRVSTRIQEPYCSRWCDCAMRMVSVSSSVSSTTSSIRGPKLPYCFSPRSLAGLSDASWTVSWVGEQTQVLRPFHSTFSPVLSYPILSYLSTVSLVISLSHISRDSSTNFIVLNTTQLNSTQLNSTQLTLLLLLRCFLRSCPSILFFFPFFNPSSSSHYIYPQSTFIDTYIIILILIKSNQIELNWIESNRIESNRIEYDKRKPTTHFIYDPILNYLDLLY